MIPCDSLWVNKKTYDKMYQDFLDGVYDTEDDDDDEDEDDPMDEEEQEEEKISSGDDDEDDEGKKLSIHATQNLSTCVTKDLISSPPRFWPWKSR